MALWCVVLILLGVWGLVRDILALEIPFFLTSASHVAVILVALGLLVRIRHKRKYGTVEVLKARVAELEAELARKDSGEAP